MNITKKICILCILIITVSFIKKEEEVVKETFKNLTTIDVVNYIENEVSDLTYDAIEKYMNIIPTKNYKNLISHNKLNSTIQNFEKFVNTSNFKNKEVIRRDIKKLYEKI